MGIFSEQQRQNAQQSGIAISYYDIDGRFIEVTPSTLDYFIDLLQPATVAKTKSKNRFDDVIVANENQPVQYDLNRVGLKKEMPADYQLSDDTGEIKLNQTLSSFQSITLPSLSYGYYSLQISQNKKIYRVRLLIRPKTAYQPPLLTEKKAWGLTIQLYSLRSERNWGIGDFGDLRYLIERAVDFGVDFVGINPLHMLYPAIPEWASPYSASSRRWLNYIYLDIPALPEFSLCKTVRQQVDELQSVIAELRQAELVDYVAVNQLKLSVLNHLFAFFNRSKSKKIVERRKYFTQFVKEQGDALLYQGLFNVLDSQENQFLPDDDNKIGWLGWRKEWQHLNAKKRHMLLTQHQEQVMFYAWL
ncbi:MAG TPA: 4-alpha-glucanotransferase, partial [Pasteurellaceae bacterium]|nr:4-alpha-glucanotransferase [Pasteurellaceae bacterium]